MSRINLEKDVNPVKSCPSCLNLNLMRQSQRKQKFEKFVETNTSTLPVSVELPFSTTISFDS